MPPSSLSEAVIICTRNRPSDLRSTLQSIASQRATSRRRVFVVDASNPAVRCENQDALQKIGPNHWHHLTYDGTPSSARQRNYGISLIPSWVDVIHFLDDDVTLHSGYFAALTHALHKDTNLGGVGGIVYEDACSSPPHHTSPLATLFLLDGPPGEMLSSGHAPSAQRYPPSASPPTSPVPTEYLNGCSSYRREVIAETKFDPILNTQSLCEDLDLSYRVSHSHDLKVIPEAKLTHHRSPRNRQSITRYARKMVVHRYWLVCKHDLSKVAFWWSVLGQFGARLLSSQSTKWVSLNGLLQGIACILRNNSPLLSSPK